MISTMQQLVREWQMRTAMSASPVTVALETQPACHVPKALPLGKCAVYVFSLAPTRASGSDNGAMRVLKVGKAGPKSNARFQSHHYGIERASSTLARSLVEASGLWDEIGFASVYASLPGRWIRQHTDRFNLYLDAAESDLLADLEQFMQARLVPLFEGRTPLRGGNP